MNRVRGQGRGQEGLQESTTSKVGTQNSDEGRSDLTSFAQAHRDYSGPSTVACQGGPDPQQARSKRAYLCTASFTMEVVVKKKKIKSQELSSEFGTTVDSQAKQAPVLLSVLSIRE